MARNILALFGRTAALVASIRTISNSRQPSTIKVPKRFGAGFVIFYPSWRGENDNPGKFELCGGEADDLVSAVDYARKLSYVDTDRVYLVGYDIGGTLVLLAAELGAPVRMVISLGGVPDLSAGVPAARDGSQKLHYAPFEFQDNQQIYLRSPKNFVADLKIPTWYIEGQFSAALSQQAHEMEVRAKKYNAPFHTAFVQMADHFAFLHSTKRLLVEKLKADTGKTLNFSFTQMEATDAFQRRRQAKPQIVDKPFAEIDEHSAKVLGNDLSALEKEMQHLGPKVPVFVRVFRSPDDEPRAEEDLDYDIDDVQCTVQRIDIVADRDTLAALKHVKIRMIGDRWLMATRAADAK